jgi:hypothetical protein
MLRDMNAAFGGYCTMSFADNNDLGRGLKLEVQKLNPRSISQTALNQLKNTVGANDTEKPFSRLARYHPRHAIAIVLPIQYLDLSSLQKDAFAPSFPAAQWVSGAANASAVMILANGNHRRMLCEFLGKQEIELLRKIQASVDKLISEPSTTSNTARMNELSEKRQALLPKIREATSWLVAIYDQGRLYLFQDIFVLISTADKIRQSPYAREILYELSKNQHSYQANDDDFDNLQLTINHFLSIPRENRLREIQKVYSKSSVMVGSMTKRMQPVFRDSSLFAQLVDLYPYSRLWTTKAFTLNMVYGWRISAVPVRVFQRTLFLGITQKISVYGGHHRPRSVYTQLSFFFHQPLCRAVSRSSQAPAQ